MATTYTWSEFPEYGIDQYYITGKNVLDQWHGNFVQLDADIAALQDGTGLADGAVITSKLADGAVAFDKLDATNTPQLGYAVVCNTTAGKFEYQRIDAIVGADTYQVKMESEASPPDFLGNLLGDNLSIVNGNLTAEGSVPSRGRLLAGV